MLVCLATGVSAQLASEIAVAHRAGQTFITWREAALSGVRYRVYRSNVPILSWTDLALADWLGEVDDKSSYNAERSRVEHGVRTWILAPDAAPLALDQGVFVHTVEADSAEAFYAVTAVRGGIEGTLVTPGRNASNLPVAELCAPPAAVLQAETSTRATWAHWVSDRDTPFQPGLSLTPSHGFDFCLEPGKSAGPRGLLLRLHAVGGTYAQGWPPRGLVPDDVDVLALSDSYSTPGYTFWFGAHELFPAAPAADTHVVSFTQQRVLWTLDWASAHLGDALDAERVSLAGTSLGAIGGMYLLEEAPQRFAAALLRNGNFDLQSGDMADIVPFEKLYGPFALDLPMRSGLPVLTRTNARAMSALAPGVDWPLIRTLNGRQDTRVGWASAVSLFAGLREGFRPAVNYFDDRVHSANGYWTTLERALVRRTCQIRRDRPSLRFDECTLDEDPGDGSRTSGDTIGTLAGRVDYDPLSAAAGAAFVRFDVFLRNERALDDAHVAEAFAALTPRRTGPFALTPGELVHFTLHEGATLVDEHWLVADELGLVHTPLVPLTKTRREARFEREILAANAAPGIRLGQAPLPGDELQLLVTGKPGERWEVVVVEGAAGSCARTSGSLDERGLADVRLELSALVPAGTRIRARARIGAVTAWSEALVQAGMGVRVGAPVSTGLIRVR